MSSQRSSKPIKPPNQSTPLRPSSTLSSSSLSSHLAMVELKQRIINSLSKLSDRDTHQIAVEDLEKIINSLSNDGVPMLLNCLYDAGNDSKPAVKKESLRLLAALCAAHSDPCFTHLTKIIAHIVKKLKDSDSQVREACREAIGSLAALYFKGGNGADGVVSLFVKPLFEVMNENNKTAQGGAAMCIAKMIECASHPPLMAFPKLCPRVCKYLNSPNFMAKASLLPVVSRLSQVGAIAPQNLETLLQSIQECLGSSDWATRKAAAETLISLALHSSNLVADKAAPTMNVLEACRFDKIKPVRDSMTEALQLWKKIAGKGDGSSDDQIASSHDGKVCESAERLEKNDLPSPGEKRGEVSRKDSSNGSSPTNSTSKDKVNNVSDKAVGILKKKPPALTDKLNPEFFQKLEKRGSDDLPVEVIVPRRCLNPSDEPNEEDSEANDMNSKGATGNIQPDDDHFKINYKNVERGASGSIVRERHGGDRGDVNQREYGINADFPKNPNQSEGFINNKGNWMTIQRQLLQLERQQSLLMNMLQDFMGGSHDNMITLENRVRGLERVVEGMARDLSMSGRRAGGITSGFDGSSNRHIGKYNGFSDYSSSKLGTPFSERYAAFDGVRGRGPSWRSDPPDAPYFHAYGKNGQRRLAEKAENEADQVSGRRAWEKGSGPVRFGEGPSARSVWQASKDEATLEAIRFAGEDNGDAYARSARIPEMNSEAIENDGRLQERDPTWASWSNAMDALHVGDVDTAFSEVLSTGDDLLLAKLMDRTGPVIDQLSLDLVFEVLHVVAQIIVEPNFFGTCLYWVQQLMDIVSENGPDVLGIPMEVKREILLNLQEASLSVELPEDWEGEGPDHILDMLASAWEIDLQHLSK